MSNPAARVFNFTNEHQKKKETDRTTRASHFYSSDVEKVLNMHKREWTAHGRGELSKMIKENSFRPSVWKTGKVTPMEMLWHQVTCDYSSISEFKNMAYQGQFVPFYIPEENGTIESLKKGTRDNRPELVVVVRTCPSKILVEQHIPYEHRKIVPRRSDEEGAVFEFKSEEDKNLETLRKAGLDKRIKVAFVFVVPYNPEIKWPKNTPPPEHALHFGNYFKFALSCFTRSKIVVCFNSWSTKMVLAKGNADQLVHVQDMPSFGESESGINIYPLGRKNRNFRNMGLTLWRLPHSIMWQEQGTTSALYITLRRAIETINSSVHLEKGVKRNAFSMMRKSVNKAAKPPTDVKEPSENINIKGDEGVGESMEIDRPSKGSLYGRIDWTKKREITTDQVWEHLKNLGLKEKTDMGRQKQEWMCKNINNMHWKVPANYFMHVPSIHACECPMCRGTSKWCTQPTDLSDLIKKGVRGRLDPLPCEYCCCKHGHRNRMNQCVGTKHLGTTFMGCKGWRIEEVDSKAKTLIQLHNYYLRNFGWIHRIDNNIMIPVKQKDDHRLINSIKRVPLEFVKLDIPRSGPLKEGTGSYDYLHAKITLDEQVVDSVRQLPTLEQLCVEKIRNMARIENIVKGGLYTKLHHVMAKNAPKDILDKWFRQCPMDIIGDKTTKYIWTGNCCSKCTKEYVPQKRTNAVDVRTNIHNKFYQKFVSPDYVIKILV